MESNSLPEPESNPLLDIHFGLMSFNKNEIR
jgi:hypothetical protein